jgi:hypothetical protein
MLSKQSQTEARLDKLNMMLDRLFQFIQLNQTSTPISNVPPSTETRSL